MFDGHGGRETAVWAFDAYPKILKDTFKAGMSEDETKEWLRRSFLIVDEMLETDEHINKLIKMRQDVPPAKP